MSKGFNIEDENQLLANNLKRIDMLPRGALLQLLHKATNDKTNTRRLRSQARLLAIRTSGFEVDLDLSRVEEST